MRIYLIGSLRNIMIPGIAARIRTLGFDVFDDWYAAGPEADDYWQKYEKERNHDFAEALAGHAAKHVFEYDRHHLDDCSIGVLVLPAGKSGHLEAGYLIGQGKPVYILLDQEPDRYDVMYKFANGIFTTELGLFNELQRRHGGPGEEDDGLIPDSLTPVYTARAISTERFPGDGHS